jgi:hypothetical protein
VKGASARREAHRRRTTFTYKAPENLERTDPEEIIFKAVPGVIARVGMFPIGRKNIEQRKTILSPIKPLM